VKYDTKTDKYERALVFKSLQQTWFRKDNRTETIERVLTEKVYPAKVFHITSISAIPVNTPTPTVTVKPTSLGPEPVISGITPNYGTEGDSVSISNLAGRNFQPGATVKLSDATGLVFIASGVLATDTKITCIINLNGASVGKADIVVINPDGQSATLTDGFTVYEPGPVVTSVTPGEGMIGQTLDLSITGKNFKDPSVVFLTKGTAEIHPGNVKRISATQITCVLVIPNGTATGPWGITVRSVADKQNGTASNIFRISNAT
jgi:hypothetical protein